MDADLYIQRIVSLQKMAAESWQNSAIFFQSQAFETGNRMLDLSDWVPKESATALKRLQSFSRQALNRLNTYIDTSFSTYEKLLGVSQKQSAPKSRPTKQPRTEGAD